VTIESGLRDLLTGDAAVSALVGRRVFPAPAPQDTAWPFVTWQRISGLRDQTLDGPSGMALPVFQIDIWCDSREQLQGASSYMPARAIADAVRRLLDGYTGMIGGNRAVVMLLDERDLSEDEPRITRVSMDFRIRHEEA